MQNKYTANSLPDMVRTYHEHSIDYSKETHLSNLQKQIDENRERSVRESNESLSEFQMSETSPVRKGGRRSIETILKLEAGYSNPMPLLAGAVIRENARKDTEASDYFWGSIESLSDSKPEIVSPPETPGASEVESVIGEMCDSGEVPNAELGKLKKAITRKPKIPIKTNRAQKLRALFIESRAQPLPSNKPTKKESKPATKDNIEKINHSAQELISALKKLGKDAKLSPQTKSKLEMILIQTSK